MYIYMYVYIYIYIYIYVCVYIYTILTHKPYTLSGHTCPVCAFAAVGVTGRPLRSNGRMRARFVSKDEMKSSGSSPVYTCDMTRWYL